ncbi:DUF397 domain-containing protein [Streptomyces sp. NPDC058256]|uniref:DUF397 domain-containing protein n=1 Tax=Streptomyces sp. NPDC058256 TaxID=3346408 RepID=UPI0036F1328B
MQTTHWQKSTFSGDSSNCVYVAAPAPGTLHLRESDEPDIILATTPDILRSLIRTLKGNLSRDFADPVSS